jgi:hypothetical protein
MRLVLGILLFTLSCFSSASECKISEEQEAKMEKYLFEMGVTWQFSFLTTLAELRKNAYKEGSLSLIEKIDEALLIKTFFILDMLGNKTPAVKQKAYDSLKRFLEDNQYYPLNWSESDADVVRNEMLTLTKEFDRK